MVDKNIYEVKFNNLRLTTGTMEAAAELIFRSLFEPGNISIFTHFNLYNYYSILKHSELMLDLRQYSILFFDGIAMKLAAWTTGKGWHFDVNGTDMYPIVFKKLSQSSLTVYLLGARDWVIKNACLEICREFPGFKIVGYHSGFFENNEEKDLIEIINNSGADLLISGMGIVKECNFAIKHKDELKVKAIWNVGGMFDFISKHKPRAPKFIRMLRLEWFFRFLIEPRYMFYRYFILPFWFAGHLYKISQDDD